MSRCLFIHDFFQDGRLDVLAEVCEMQVYGQWTKQKRASWTKQATAIYQRSRHKTPYRPQGSSYYAGRIAGLRSAITANYPAPGQETCGKMVFLPLADKKTTFCGSCGDCASWKYYQRGNPSSIRYRCDRCKQELVRVKTTYTVLSGWDWDDDENEVPFPLSVVSQQMQLTQKKEDVMALGQIVLPLAMLTAFDVSDVLWPVDHPTLFTQLFLVILTRVASKHIVRLLFFLSHLMEREDTPF